MKYAALFALLAVASAGDLSAVDNLNHKFYDLENKLWKNITGPKWSEIGFSGDVELTKAFVAFDELIQSVPTPPRPPVETWLWKMTKEKMQIIDGHYANFLTFIKQQANPGAVPAPVKEWLDVAEGILMDPNSSVAQAVRKIHDLLEYGDIFHGVLKEDHPDLCDLQMSPHQLIYDMYNTISLSEIKGYAMMQFSWMLLRIYGKGNFTEEANLTRVRYAERTSLIATYAKSTLSAARRNLHRCDPPEHKLGETYEEVTKLLQGYVENEVDMNPEGTCRENCAYYTVADNYGCFKEKFCRRQTKCNGRILDCQYIDSDMDICLASPKSHRRYEWIRYENGKTLGRYGQCTRGSTKVDSWWKWSLVHCSYCFCLCEEDVKWSDRSFSLREELADIEKNKVVTGLRLVKHGRIFHLQISEGTLGARGLVTPGSWVPIQKFDISEPGIQDGVDYHTLTYERRAIDLDELDSPAGHILTGVRLRMIGAHLHFEIRSTPFNYTTGRLSPERSQWISNDNTEGADTPRSRLVLNEPDIPIRSSVPQTVDSKHDQYIEFVNSDLVADAAQSTVPFIDIQPLEPLKGAALLSGAGLVHRGAPRSGGFVSAELIAYDQSQHVRAAPPPDRVAEPEDDVVLLPGAY